MGSEFSVGLGIGDLDGGENSRCLGGLDCLWKRIPTTAEYRGGRVTSCAAVLGRKRNGPVGSVLKSWIDINVHVCAALFDHTVRVLRGARSHPHTSRALG